MKCSALVASPATAQKQTQLQDVAQILAAMTPCCRLYAFLGCLLSESYSLHNHAYSDWIRKYSSPDFLALADKSEQLLNLLGRDAPFGNLLLSRAEHPTCRSCRDVGSDRSVLVQGSFYGCTEVRCSSSWTS